MSRGTVCATANASDERPRSALRGADRSSPTHHRAKTGSWLLSLRLLKSGPARRLSSPSARGKALRTRHDYDGPRSTRRRCEAGSMMRLFMGRWSFPNVCGVSMTGSGFSRRWPHCDAGSRRPHRSTRRGSHRRLRASRFTTDDDDDDDERCKPALRRQSQPAEDRGSHDEPRRWSRMGDPQRLKKKRRRRANASPATEPTPRARRRSRPANPKRRSHRCSFLLGGGRCCGRGSRQGARGHPHTASDQGPTPAKSADLQHRDPSGKPPFSTWMTTGLSAGTGGPLLSRRCRPRVRRPRTRVRNEREEPVTRLVACVSWRQRSQRAG